MMLHPSPREIDIDGLVKAIRPLYHRMKEAKSVGEKLDILNADPSVTSYISENDTIRMFLANVSSDCDLVIKSILAIGQGPVIFNGIDQIDDKFDQLRQLIQVLLEVEKFYDSMGGIVGYYYTTIKLISRKTTPQASDGVKLNYYVPEGIDLVQQKAETRAAVRAGIENLPKMGEIYPLGGAGDRLDLHDPNSGDALPAAYLPFGGMTLLEGLLRDLQAKEFLYWKLKEEQLKIPVAIMTSQEKHNTAMIEDVFHRRHWFGRERASFRFFEQPLVPVIVETGDFSLKEPLELTLKPGGHGALWKLALDKGVLAWFESQGCAKILLRQINNPVAGTDDGILTLTGIGCSQGKAFGIASCPRLVNATEGTLAIVEKEEGQEYSYFLTNIEYMDFKAKGFEDAPAKEGSPYSSFPANTNILFSDLAAIREALEQSAVPGVVVNMSHQVPYTDAKGSKGTAPGGRLESMMQNIAEHMVQKFSHKLNEKERHNLFSFVTFNSRPKTISVTKRQMIPGKAILETPESCFYDMQLNASELLVDYCHCTLPAMPTLEQHIKGPLPFIFTYHPALGPIWDLIAQKFHDNVFKKGAELQLEIVEVDIVGLTLEGSLIVSSLDPLGHTDAGDNTTYGSGNGKCELKNVTVTNKGIDFTASNRYWSNEIFRNEECEIVLHGNGEFFAEGVTFKGKERFEVANGYRLEITEQEGQRVEHLNRIDSPTWQWKYSFDADDRIKLEKLTTHA
jgi:hypothetical protein